MEITDELIKTIVEKESWEDVIYYIVNVEKIDPWNVDIVKLCTGFINFMKKVEELDFRIPAKIVFVAAILLRLKVEYLSILEDKEEEKEVKQTEFLDIDPSLLKLSYPVKRIPKRQITLDELISALKKAMEIEKRREERRIRSKVKFQINIADEEDMSKRIEALMKEIEEKLKKTNYSKISFREIVGEWKRDKIVKKFIPILHLEKEEKITTEQVEFFKDFWIKKK